MATTGSDKRLSDLDLRRNPDDLVDFVTRFWRIGQSEATPRRRIWEMHRKHFAGNWYLTYDMNSHAVADTDQNFIDPSSGFLTIAVNLATTYAMQRRAKWQRGEINWGVIPETDDQSDRDRAEHGKRIAKHLWSHLQMERKWRQCLGWVTTAHNVFLRSGWDAEAGKRQSVGLEELFDMEQLGQMEEDEKAAFIQSEMGMSEKQYAKYFSSLPIEYFQGDNIAEVVPPHHMLVDPDADRFEDAEFAMQTRVRTKQYLLDRYPNMRGEIENLVPQTEWEGYDLDSAADMFGLDGGGYGFSEQAEELTENFLVHELVHKKNGQYEEGAVGVVCQDTVLYQADSDCPERLPWVHIQEIPVENELWATGAWTFADPIQQAVNVIHRKVMTFICKCASPGGLFTGQLGLDPNDLVDEPGWWTKVKSLDNTYRLWEWPDAPPYLLDEYERLNVAMQTMFGAFDPDMGRPSGQASSGYAINLLTEQNEMAQTEIIKGFETCLARFGGQQLYVVSKNWTEDRTIWVVGENGEREYRTVSGQDLIGADAGHPGMLEMDIEVTIDRHRTKAERIEEIDFLLERGVLNPERDRDEILGAMRFKSPVTGAWGKTQFHRSKANHENQLILMGHMPEVRWGDNDSVHVEEHEAIIGTEEWDRTVSQNPMMREAMMLHINTHYEQAATKIVLPQMKFQQVQMGLMAQSGMAPVSGPGPNGQAPAGPGAGRQTEPSGSNQ